MKITGTKKEIENAKNYGFNFEDVEVEVLPEKKYYCVFPYTFTNRWTYTEYTETEMMEQKHVKKLKWFPDEKSAQRCAELLTEIDIHAISNIWEIDKDAEVFEFNINWKDRVSIHEVNIDYLTPLSLLFYEDGIEYIFNSFENWELATYLFGAEIDEK